MTDEQSAWHLDKRIPIALITATVVQTGALIWWAATLTSQVAGHSEAISEFRAARINERLPVIELQIASLNEGMGRLDRKIDYMLYGPGQSQGVRIRPSQQW